ncbi:MAG: DNA internalization-related competence protein ComEC/Rec2 [Clostridiales bacterium]|nr:DNA internalization-related competence protein ComEC/Rec2 [Clostridiales bacterium]
MSRCNQLNAVIMKIFDAVIKRPLVVPAILAVVCMCAYYSFVDRPSYHENISCPVTVRDTHIRADGTVQYVFNTYGYGRILYSTDVEEPFDTGDELYIEGYLNTPAPPSNPGEFDYADYLHRRGINGVVKLESFSLVKEKSSVMQVSCAMADLFEHVRGYALSVFDDGDRGMAAALFMGDTSLLDDDITRSFRLSDCSHLLAVSGTHFAGFLMMLSDILTRLKIKRKYSTPVFVCFCVLTGMFTGWSESVTRACVMSICGFLARDYASGMSLAVIMLMVNDPYSCLSNGFQMSFAASLSIRLLGNGIERRLLACGLPETICEVLTPVIAATIGMIPFWCRTCYYFSLVHLLTQILASFLAAAACVFFIPTVITGLSMPCSLVFYLLKTLTGICSSVAFEGSSSAGLTPAIICTSFILICLYMMPRCIIRKFLLMPAFAAFVIASGMSAVSYLNAPEVTIVFIDVGQGDCCLIMSEGRSMLIDGGVEAEGRYAVSAVLDYYGIGSVDLAVATHMDEDHIGGLEYLDSVGRIDNLYSCYDLSAGDVISMTDNLRLYCVWPNQVKDGGNEDSVVLRLEYEDFSILFTGDIGFDSEAALIEEGADIDADVLKVAHHGSAYSTSSLFLEYVSPEEAVISVVANSPYGHPAPATLERLEDYGCIIRRTDHEGAILYLLD